MKKLILSVLFVALGLGAMAQEETTISKSKITASAKLTNVHLWRGGASGTAPCIEPIVTWSYNNLSVSAWAAYAIDNSYKEIDFFATYRWKFVELGIYDYYCPTPKTKVGFDTFEKGKTEHLFEAQSVFYFLPADKLQIMAAVIIGGTDWDVKVTDPVLLTQTFEQRYSTYFEVAYNIAFGKFTITPEIGLTPFKGMYAKDFNVFNYGVNVSRDLKINNFSLPTSYKVAYNSELKALHFAFGIQI